ncbi:universal stress protein [Campylobacter sp. faydin G-24]|uniref:Universal stress protein n=1 Tax=Campylobacter anatolicus TaxID=2829105 RepID=A0ABS5HFP3_9BACT|nr:universal stress protein [Campylobacter anatolicus]MBR8462480.1 universal stress protein [Campylobacter anatolicus]MBR8463088.1 universal stress protein [Campylobacter anatolicus]MBR8465590.1 universal stress protein [Campylobacter anatolicus]
MKYKKILFPIGAGDDIEPRIYGALKVAKWLKTHIEVMAFQLDPSIVYNMKMTLRGGVLFEEFLKSAKSELEEESKQNENLFKKICADLDIKISDEYEEGICTAKFTTHRGKRSAIVKEKSKFCDMVIAAVPIDGRITGTFEAAVIKSGKNVIAIPRNLKEFSADNILVSWTDTSQSSRALTSSIGLLKRAKKVHCITSRVSLGDDTERNLQELEEYFKLHDIKATFDVIDTTSIPGEALLKAAKENKSDLIVAGRHGENGLIEMVLGGTSRFFLAHTDIPVFM